MNSRNTNNNNNNINGDKDSCNTNNNNNNNSNIEPRVERTENEGRDSPCNEDGEERNLEDMYEEKKRDRMLEEERGEDERKRLDELMKMMESGDKGSVSAGIEIFANSDHSDDGLKSATITQKLDDRRISLNEKGVNEDAMVDPEDRIVGPAPDIQGELRREGGSFDTYLNALSDFNEKFYKLKETSFTQEDYNSEAKKHFDEKSYVIASSQPSKHTSIITQHTSPDSIIKDKPKMARNREEESDEEDEITGVSPIPDSGVEFCSPDWVQFSQPFQRTPEKRSSLSKKSPHYSSYQMPQLSSSRPSSLQQRHYHLSTPRIVQSSARSASEDGRHISSLSNPHLLSTHPRLPPSSYRPSHKFSPMNESRLTKFGSDSKILRSERYDESQQELRILRELQRDVVLNIDQLRRDISQTEAQQSEALRDLDVERALLGGERRLVMVEVDGLREQLRITDARLKELSKKIHKDHHAMKAEKTKLKELEARRKEIDVRMKEKNKILKIGVDDGVEERLRGEGSEDGVDLEAEWRDAKEEEDAQRAVLENLEFQLLEGESREEDKKEEEEGKVVEERERLVNMLANKQVDLDEMTTQETELVRQVERDGEELTERLRLLGQQLDKERSILDNINQQTDLLISFSSAIHPHKLSYQALNRRNESWTKSSSPHHYPSLHHHQPHSFNYPHQRRTTSQTLPLLESYKYPSLQRDRIAFMKTFEERSYRYHLKPKAPGFSPTSNPALFPNDWSKNSQNRDLTQKAASWMAVNSESEESCSESESEKDPSDWSKGEVLEKIRNMECQLLIAKAEKMKLVDRQKKELESMQGEIRRRRGDSIDRKVDSGVLRRGEEAKKEDAAESTTPAVSLLQSRPLTRYLPTHDRPLDLVSFITSCGHNLQLCRHLVATSISCRGYLSKMTGCHLRKWKKRWFAFDRSKRSLSYYANNRETKAKAVLYFQSIEDVFVDHLHQVSSPTPQLTFCLKTLQRVFFLVAPSADTMRIWIDVLSTGAEAHHRFA